ncbi:MAG: heme-binding protein [Chthoniobacter sp.]|uniref:bifunctional GlcG/HbpS family heme-binding protein/cupin domain-containing protein n=1 Tax=Chthoniobacter sp. TaxID=2510640 RepID=UPI0032A7AE1F
MNLKSILPALIIFAGLAQAQVAERKSLTLDGARQVIVGAIAYAKAHNAPGGVIAVVDDGGNLMALERLDGTFAAGANISIGKARTAALFKKPTKFFEDVINKGRTAMAAMHENFTPLQGGVPILMDGQIIGAVGVSGASSAQQDEELALAGAGAITGPAKTGAASPTATPATVFPAKDVFAAFAKDGRLLETAAYKVNASLRVEPGQAEVHARETDVFYVVEGTATLVVGGTVIEPNSASMDEIRGQAIAGGETHQLRPGDVVVIPAGTPHQFTAVRGPFHYFVVKPISSTATAFANR